MNTITKVRPKSQIKIKRERSIETESPQVGDLVQIRNLVVFGVENQIYDRSVLTQQAIQDGLLCKEDGTPYNKESSIYRFLDTLRFLNFDETPRRDKSGTVKWSECAKELASYGSINYRTNILSELEKEIRLFDTCFGDAYLLKNMFPVFRLKSGISKNCISG